MKDFSIEEEENMAIRVVHSNKLSNGEYRVLYLIESDVTMPVPALKEIERSYEPSWMTSLCPISVGHNEVKVKVVKNYEMDDFDKWKLCSTKKEISQEYYDHYMSIYGDREAQRLELTLRGDACKTFNKFFFHDSYDKKRTLEYTLADFGRNHRLQDIGTQTRASRYPTNRAFSELFCLHKIGEFKQFRTHLEKKADIKASKMVFSKEGHSVEKVGRMLGKKLSLHNTSHEIDLLTDSLRGIPYLNSVVDSMQEHKGLRDDREECFQKTLAFFDMSEDELYQARLSLNRGENFLKSSA